MGNKGLFPGVAVPLAFFCTLFFRHRKKSVSALWDGKSQFAPESARHSPPRGIAYGKVVNYRRKQGGFPLAPLHPRRIATRSNRAPHRAASPSPAPESARQAPPRGIAYGKVVNYRCKQGGFPLAPCTPSGSRRIHTGQGVCASGRVGGFPRGKQSTRHSP